MNLYKRQNRKACLIGLLGLVCGCTFIGEPERVLVDPQILELQQSMAQPKERLDLLAEDPNRSLGILMYPRAKASTGPNEIHLTVEQAIAKALARSPQITIVSLDASIAQQAIIASKAELDPTLFGRYNLEENDQPQASAYEIGRSSTRTTELGIKQRIPTGAEYALTYALTRTWDDLWYHGYQDRFTPVLAFQIRQPILRDAGTKATLAGIDVAKLNHQIALLAFRQKAEELATEVLTAYWRLAQARQELQIQQEILQMASETLEKVKARVGIDATEIQVQQATFSLAMRRSQLVQAQRLVRDAQDRLARLISDPQMDLLSNYQIIPQEIPEPEDLSIDQHQALALAMSDNPAMTQARLALRVAQVNWDLARNQQQVRLDLVASASSQALGYKLAEPHEDLLEADKTSYAVGVVLEYPLGNRQRSAETARRRLEYNKAVANLQDLADQLAVQVKERYRQVLAAMEELEVQTKAVEAARTQLQAITDSEPIRDRLTPEFLLVKLQAQDALAESMRARNRALAEYQIAVAELAQATGRVLGLYTLQVAPGKNFDRNQENHLDD
ncbi:MAG: TolC family protein [Sedimentisphaerales bacterium]|nr:TolC family protein [Sedimentisphaerales bacterium]